MRHENLGNLSHLPEPVIDAIRAMLAGRKLVDFDEAFEIERSLPHGHVAAVLGVLRALDLERLLSRSALPGARPRRRHGGATAARAGIEAVGDPPFHAVDARR